MADDAPERQAVVEEWAKAHGLDVPPEVQADLEKRLDRAEGEKAISKQQRSTWDRVKSCLGWLFVGSAIAVGGTAAVYTIKKGVDAMPEAAEHVLKRELGERGAILDQKAESMKHAGGVLIEKVKAFLEAIPEALANADTLSTGAQAFVGALVLNIEGALTGKDNTASEALKRVQDFLKNDPNLSPYWKEVESAFEELKKQGEDLASMQWATEVTDEDKAQAWEDYKSVLWAEIKSDFGVQSKKTLPTSSPVQESQE
jgi:hypothetical protein